MAPAAAVAAHQHQRRGEHGQRQRHPLQRAEHRAGDVALGGVEADEVVVLRGGEVVHAEVRAERGEHEDAGQADAGVRDGGAEPVLEAPPLGRLDGQGHLGRARWPGRRRTRPGRRRRAGPTSADRPEQRLDGVEDGQGEDEEGVVLVEDRVGGAERLAVEPEQHVLPVPGEEGAAGDPGDHRDGDARPERDPAAVPVQVARRAHPAVDAQRHAAAGDRRADEEEHHLGEERRPEDVGVVEARVVEVAGAQPEQPSGPAPPR